MTVKMMRQGYVSSVKTPAHALQLRPVCKVFHRALPVCGRPYPKVAISAAGSDSSDAVEPSSDSLPGGDALQKASGLLKKLSFCSFWLQLALTLVSSGVLFFSEFVGGYGRAGLAMDVAKGFSLGSVTLCFVSTFFAFSFLRLSRQLASGGTVNAVGLAANLLRSSTINLWGIGLTTFGLQASVGTLVGKTLTQAAQQPFQYGAPAGGSLVSIDVFALQASTNILLCHLAGLAFSNVMSRVVNDAMAKRAASA